MKIRLTLTAAFAALALSSCSGVIPGLTGQPVPTTPVKREGGTPINVATSDLVQAEIGPADKAYGLYDVGAVANVVGKASVSPAK